jgi:hypothetical protein
MPSGIFLLGKLEDVAYKDALNTPGTIPEHITAAGAVMNSYLIQHTCESFTERLQHCIATEGYHFEHLL